MNLSASHFSSIRVLVVGDVMLDRYWFGSVERVSPEAPVPILSVTETQMRAGGAANVAHNLQALGAQTYSLSILGDDQAGSDIRNLIESYGAQADVVIDKSIRTIEKLRMMAQNHQLLRADFDQNPSEAALDSYYQAYQQALPSADVVILSDYGKGSLRDCADMIALARSLDKPVIVDPKGTDYSAYRGASLITPNAREFETVVGASHSEEQFSERAFALREQLELDSLLVTRSERGMSLFAADHTQVDSPAQALEVYDVSGAGDTVIALMALCQALKMTAKDSLHIANTAAGIVVGKVGTAVATIDEVIEKLEAD